MQYAKALILGFLGLALLVPLWIGLADLSSLTAGACVVTGDEIRFRALRTTDHEAVVIELGVGCLLVRDSVDPKEPWENPGGQPVDLVGVQELAGFALDIDAFTWYASPMGKTLVGRITPGLSIFYGVCGLLAIAGLALREL